MGQFVGNAEHEAPDRAPDAARKRAAIETYSQHEATLRRTAGRYSICPDDAEEALQRALEILLRKAPSADPRELIRWTQTVVKHEALAVRRERERILAGPAAARPEEGVEDWVALIPARDDGPPEQAERREAVARSREALQALRPQELRALTLLAEGYSYREIGEITGFSQTKVNRCLAEGRERFRSLVGRSEDGRRCAEMGPLLSAFCDGETEEAELTAVREHLRACPHCRATLRTYRAAPAAVGALAPLLPLHRSLGERLQEAVVSVGARLGGDGGLSQAAAAGGSRGIGTAALAKLMAVCLGTVGGAAACVAGGVVPAPLGLDPSPAHEASADPVRTDETKAEAPVEPEASYDPPAETTGEAEPKPTADPEPPPPEPPADGGAVGYVPAAAERPGGAGSAAGTGSSAGEFGP